MKIKCFIDVGLVGCRKEWIVDLSKDVGLYDDELEEIANSPDEYRLDLTNICKETLFEQFEWGYEIVGE